MPGRPVLSIVIPSCNEGPRLEATLRSIAENRTLSTEAIVVDNGSSDGSASFIATSTWCAGWVQLLQFSERLGVAGARNEGARHARGDLLAFSDGHVLFSPGWDTAIAQALELPAAGIVSPLLGGWPGQEFEPCSGQRWRSPLFHEFEWIRPESVEVHPVPLLCGAFQAFRRERFEDFGGYDPGMINWGMEDHEICLRYWLLGLEVLSVPQATLRHYFRESHGYPVHWYHVLHNYLRAIYAHFSPERVTRVVSALAGYDGFAQACATVEQSDIWDRRVAFDARRVHDDDWFIQRFDMTV